MPYHNLLKKRIAHIKTNMLYILENTISINSFKDKKYREEKKKMDTEEDINIAAEKIMKDIAVSKLDALNMLLGRYQSQKRLEEAVIVQRIIERELTKPEDYDQGLHQDM
jgi:hypothetical protein